MNVTKVLLVEDDVLLRELYSTILGKAGYSLLVAEDGEAAMDVIENNAGIKLILLDIMLPKVNGIEVLKQLKSNLSTEKIPVLLLSNLTEESIVQEALKMGAVGYMVKVRLTPKEVIQKVQEFAGNPALDPSGGN